MEIMPLAIWNLRALPSRPCNSIGFSDIDLWVFTSSCFIPIDLSNTRDSRINEQKSYSHIFGVLSPLFSIRVVITVLLFSKITVQPVVSKSNSIINWLDIIVVCSKVLQYQVSKSISLQLNVHRLNSMNNAQPGSLRVELSRRVATIILSSGRESLSHPLFTSLSWPASKTKKIRLEQLRQHPSTCICQCS